MIAARAGMRLRRRRSIMAIALKSASVAAVAAVMTPGNMVLRGEGRNFRLTTNSAHQLLEPDNAPRGKLSLASWDEGERVSTDQ
jgi:hypothetical protein